MGRPRQHETPRSATAIRFPQELLARLHTEADARDVSVNWLVTRAVERFLRDLLPVDEMVLTRPDTTRHDLSPAVNGSDAGASSASSGEVGQSNG